MEDRELTIKVKRFWEAHPVCADMIPHPAGSKTFFDEYEKLRLAVIPYDTKLEIYQFTAYAGKKVLDIGCGNGWVLSHYAKNGATCYGLDITEKAIALSKKRFELTQFNADFTVGDSQHLPFPDQTFDLATSMGVLHHVPDTAKAISEIRRVLKPNGRILLMMYHRNSLRYRVLFPWRKFKRGTSIDHLINEFDGIENPLGKVFSRKEIISIMPGFSNLSFIVDWIMPSQYPVGRYWPKSFIRYLSKRWGYFIYVWAEKV